jgi:hypothetical protein
MARCAAFVLGTGHGDFTALDHTIDSLRRDNSGARPDVFVCLDMFNDEGRQWVREHAGEVLRAYTHPELLGWPLLLNVALDKELEDGKWDYDVVVMMSEGVKPQATNWLRNTMEGIEREGGELAVSLGGPADAADNRDLIPLGDDTYIVPRLWGGCAMPADVLRHWRAVPYLPVRGQGWLDDLSDHCVINHRVLYHDPNYQTVVPIQHRNFQTDASFDGGLIHGQA